MKISIDNIINFMRKKQNIIITDKQVKEIKKHFYKDVDKLVYWSFTERCFDIKLEGIITKTFYDRITKDEYKNKEYSFGEVIDNMGDVDFKIEEINFDDDPEIIIAYKNTDRFYDRALEDFINDDNVVIHDSDDDDDDDDD
jgi:hypothetical protein